MIYNTEKSLTDNADKIDADTKAEVEKAIAEAKAVKDGDDSDAIMAKKDALSQASLKIGQAIYSKQQASEASEATEEKKDDSTVDADFTEKSDDEQKKDDEKK